MVKIVTGYVLKFLSKLHNLLTEAGLESIVRQYASKTIAHLNTAVDSYYAMESVKGEDEVTDSRKDSAAQLQVSIGQGNLKRESVVAAILPSPTEVSYCTSRFFCS